MTAVVAGRSGAGEQQIPYGNDRKKGNCKSRNRRFLSGMTERTAKSLLD
jgi:hypothetical protein